MVPSQVLRYNAGSAIRDFFYRSDKLNLTAPIPDDADSASKTWRLGFALTQALRQDQDQPAASPAKSIKWVGRSYENDDITTPPAWLRA